MNILLTPARIGAVEIPNRIVLPPMTTRAADAEGFVTDDTLAYYQARVAGGVGLVTVEMASPEKAGRHRKAEDLSGLEVDDQFKLGWLLDGEVGRLRATQNLVDIVGGAPE